MLWRACMFLILSLFTTRAAPVKLAPDGAWCWFGNPRALYKNGVLHFGYVRNTDGRVAMSAYDPRGGSPALLWLSQMTERDDHDNPGLLDLQDGRVLALYAKHGSEKRFYYRLSQPSTSGAASNWGPELTFTNTTAGVTYSNPYQLRAEGDRLYHFMRNLNHNPTFTTSDSSGTNWSAPRILIRTGRGRTRPYVQYCSDYDRRIDFVYTDGHPLAVGNSLYHAFYKDGGIFRSDGSLLKHLANAPLQHDQGERGSVIYEFNAEPSADPNDHIPGGRAWCWDLVYDRAGAPVTVFSVQRTNVMGPTWLGDRLYYYYARWTGSEWRKRLIACAGRPLYEAERDYAGGITVDPANPDVVYLSSNAADPFRLTNITTVPLTPEDRYELYRGVTSDGGLTFSWRPLTQDSEIDNLRPYVPRRNPYTCGVIWYAGRYESYRSWQTAIYGLFEKEPPVLPLSMRSP